MTKSCSLRVGRRASGGQLRWKPYGRAQQQSFLPIVTNRRGTKVISEILKLGAKAAFVAADLEEQDAPARIISAAIDKFGRLDGLVNAAGLSDRGSVADADTALFDHLFAVNTRAPMFLMQGDDTPSQGTQGSGLDRQYLVVPSPWCLDQSGDLWCYEGCVVPSDEERRFFASKGSDSRERHQPWMDGYPWRAGDAGRQARKRRVMAGRKPSRGCHGAASFSRKTLPA